MTFRRSILQRRGFTLMEAAIVTVIVGVGVVALLQLLAAGTYANTESTELTTAMNLAGNIRELAYGVSYANVMTLDGGSYSPPVDARRATISNLPGWKQSITVNYVDPNRITVAVPKSQVEPTARITVTVSHNGRSVFTCDWLAAASEWPPP